MHRSLRTARPAVPESQSAVQNAGIACKWCWGQGAIFEPSPFGLLPILCGRCSGNGREARADQLG
jgi:hypothetical protein